MKDKIRIGVLIDSEWIPSWAYLMLEKIQQNGCAEFILLVKRISNPTKKQLFKKDFAHLLYYKVFDKLEKKIYPTCPDAFESKNIRDLIKTDLLEVNPLEVRFEDRFPPDAIAKVRNYNIDLFIRLGFRILKGEILLVPRFGIWSYHHGDNRVNRGGPAGFWEVWKQLDETGVILQILEEDLDNGTVLYRSYSKTDKESVTRNMNNYFWKAASFIPRKIEELYKDGEEAFFERVKDKNTHPYFYSEQLFKAPGNGAIIRMCIKLLIAKLKHKIRSLLYTEQWILLYSLRKTEGFSTSFFRFKKMFPPKDRFWADPFIVYRDNQYYIFFEEYLYQTNKGHISLITMDAKGNYKAPVTVLEKEYHLSYPFIIEDHGNHYMIPESSDHKTIELYKCVSFPDKWELEKVLIKDIVAVDATIHYSDGKYWLFTTVQENKGANTHDELFLFYSDTLVSDNWIPHKSNPIISDVKQARPAGKIFSYNGRSYRPSQNCSKRYGYGMKINAIIQLSTEQYEEESINSIYPNWDKEILGTHTLNNAGNLTMIDGIYLRKKF